jgi:hypothetical protein
VNKEEWLVTLFILFAAAACVTMKSQQGSTPTASETGTSVSTSVMTAPQAPITFCGAGTWCYNDTVSPMITTALMLADTFPICQKAPLDRRKLWVDIVASISYAESTWDSQNVYQEDFQDGTTGKPALSVGLLQLSINDVTKKTPNCLKITAVTLKDPSTNLGCGVEIMNWLVTRQGASHSVNDLGAYWSVMRASNARHQIVIQKLRQLEPSC